MFLLFVILLSYEVPLCSCHSGNKTVNVVPWESSNDSIASCPLGISRCLTLSQFISSLFGTSLNFSTLTLNLLPGIHAFETNNLSLDNFTSLTFKSPSTERETSIIGSPSSRLLITNVVLMRIQDLIIRGCKDIDMDFVDIFILKNTVLNSIVQRCPFQI